MNKWSIKWFLLIIIMLIVVFFLFLVIRGFRQSADTPDLSLWHHNSLFDEEFEYSSYKTPWEFLKEEEAHLTRIYSLLSADKNPHKKYIPGNLSHPVTQGKNPNASSLTYPKEEAKGAALVLHGLSDSPYHMQAVAQDLLDKNYIVFNFRLPGHGTAPGALVHITWKEWVEAVDFAFKMTELLAENTTDKKVVAAGFSTGGALLIRHTLSEALSGGVRIPHKIFLYSPAASIAPKAWLADFHEYVSWFPGLEKFQWLDVLPEEDPFKYSSFPKNAAHQIYQLTEHNKKLMNRVSESEEFRSRIPDIITFQSPFDATAEFKGVVKLYQKVGTRKSKLILFSENKVYGDLYKESVSKIVSPQEFTRGIFSSELYFIENIQPQSPLAGLFRITVDEEGLFQKELKEEYEIITWPENLFAMSHISPQIRKEDTYYGKTSKLYPGESGTRYGEYGLLRDEEKFSRARYNPFYPILSEILKDNLIQGE